MRKINSLIGRNRWRGYGWDRMGWGYRDGEGKEGGDEHQ